MSGSFHWCFGIILLLGCSGPGWVQHASEEGEVVHAVPDAVVHQAGDPEKGLHYLLNANYIGSGYPLQLMPKSFKAKLDTADADATRSRLEPEFNFVLDERRKVWIVQKNCFTCHGGPFQGEYTYGLGNTAADFTEKPGLTSKLLPAIAANKLRKGTDAHKAFTDVWQYLQVVEKEAVTPVKGVNPAFRIEEASVIHRNPVDLTYVEAPNFIIAEGPVPVADVPPLWNIDKKRALYYNGMGRGDFRKLLMQASVLGIKDSTEARKVFNRFHDVVAWAASLQPPKWPGKLNHELALEGKAIFADNCGKCHGSYGEKSTYPNKIIPLSKIGTDPYYARYFYKHSGLVSWYNNSWYAQSSAPSEMLPSLGYVAPPLDGVWATAPYLHNGSVPDLEGLLNSSSRPAFWYRKPAAQANGSDYDFDRVGWKYSLAAKGSGKNVYNTTKPGYGNAGHTYGDKLSDAERKAVIEYLKTL
jgi:mono/diheme cytochrome c family protein